MLRRIGSFFANYDLRRFLLEAIHWLSEQLELLIRIGASIVGSSAALVFARKWSLFQKISEPLEKVLGVVDVFLKYADVAIVLFALVSALILRLQRDPNKLWALALDKHPHWRRSDSGNLLIRPRTRCLIHFPSVDEAGMVAHMNHAAFAGTAFSTPEDVLLKRNSEWIAKNPRIFMLAVDPVPGNEYVGYSALLPLNEHGTQLYREGVLKDSKIPEEFITREGERPSSVLFFALALKEEYRNHAVDRQHLRQLCYLFHCVQMHLYEMYSSWDAGAVAPPLLAQAERGSMQKLLKQYGFHETTQKTGDHFSIWELKQPLLASQSIDPASETVVDDNTLLGEA